jgi:adenine-specific DNA-methyltransferase
MEKLTTSTRDLIGANIEKLAAAFPECVTQVDSASGSKNGDGAGDGPSRALKVDFERLKKELSGFLVEGETERYGLKWPGKAASIKAAGVTVAKTLRPLREGSLNFDSTRHLYVEGDNLDALKILGRSYLGKIKLIYIDPPYNTGSDLLYRDDFKLSPEDYLRESGQADADGSRLVANTEANGRFHSDWLSMMYPRLKLAKELLAENGSIFISVDDREADNLKKISQEIFGEKNFVAQVCVKGSGGRQDSRHFAIVHSYALIFAKNIDRFVSGRKIPKIGPFNAKALAPKTQLLRKWGDAERREDRPNLYYPIKDPDGADHYPLLPDGSPGRWRWGKEAMRRAMERGLVAFKKIDGGYQAYEIIDESDSGAPKFTTWIDDVGVSDAIGSVKELFGEKIFDYPKSLSLMKTFLRMGAVEKDDLVLDFFSGSATMGHAIYELNADEGLNLRFILVQLREPCGEKSLASLRGYKNISQIGEERLRRAAKKVREKAVKKAKEGGDIFSGPPIDPELIDLGFRVFRVDSSGFIEPGPKPDGQENFSSPDLLSLIKPDRSKEDLLFEAILAFGLEPTLPYRLEKAGGVGPNGEIIAGEVSDDEIYVVGQNQLIASFAKDVREDLLVAMASRYPERALFLSEGFKSDAMALNAGEIFQKISPLTVVKTI